MREKPDTKKGLEKDSKMGGQKMVEEKGKLNKKKNEGHQAEEADMTRNERRV